MSETKVMNRWIVVAGGIVVQLCLGAIYAWSAFTQRLTNDVFNFTRTETQIVFALGLLSFATVMALVAGRWERKVGPRIVSITGGLVLGLGYILAGLAGTSFWGILLGVGLLGGAGIGLAYVCPIAALVKWFPDKKGMITGMAVAGFGFGALIWIKLTQGFSFGPVDLTPGWNGLYGMGWGVSDIFIFYGVLFALLVGLGSLVLVNPPAGWQPKGWEPPSAAVANHTGGIDYTTREMMKTPQFWMLFVTFVVAATAGLMVIGIIKLFGTDSLTARGIGLTQADVITGTAMGLFYALFNGLGRIVWGAVSDKLGRKNTLVFMTLLQGVMMILFFYIGKFEWGLYLGATIIGFNYGGYFGVLPASIADFFGNKSVGTNYPWLFLAYGIGGLVGPILGGVMGDMKIWGWAFIPAGIASLAAGVMCMALKPPPHK